MTIANLDGEELTTTLLTKYNAMHKTEWKDLPELMRELGVNILGEDLRHAAPDFRSHMEWLKKTNYIREYCEETIQEAATRFGYQNVTQDHEQIGALLETMRPYIAAEAVAMEGGIRTYLTQEPIVRNKSRAVN